MNNLTNPFRPGNGIMPPYLAGRGDEVAQAADGAGGFAHVRVACGVCP